MNVCSNELAGFYPSSDERDSRCSDEKSCSDRAPQEKAPEMGKTKVSGNEKEETEEEVSALIRKKSRRDDRAETERDTAGK